MSLILILVILVSCNEKDKQIVNVGLLNGPSSISMVQSIKKESYYEGRNVHYVIKDNPQHVRALLVSGNLDMAILPMTMAYNMIDNNIDIKIFAITGWGNLYLLGRDNITDLSELSGKTISVPGEGQTPDLVSKFLLEYLYLQDKVNLNYTYPAPLLLASALAVGKIEYAVLPEPLASLALSKDNSLKRCMDISEEWNKALPNIPLVQSVFVVRSDFYKRHVAWFDAYANEVEKNSEYTQLHQDETIELAKKLELLPPTIAATDIITNSHLDFVRDEKMADNITNYLKTFYILDEDFDIHPYLITK